MNAEQKKLIEEFNTVVQGYFPSKRIEYLQDKLLVDGIFGVDSLMSLAQMYENLSNELFESRDEKENS